MDPDAGVVQRPPPPPPRVTIKRMTADRVALYHPVPPPGRSIPVEVNPFPVEYSILEEADITEVVNRAYLNRLGGPLGMRVEYICQWLREAIREKYPDATNWEKVVAIVQAAFW